MFMVLVMVMMVMVVRGYRRQIRLTRGILPRGNLR